MSITYKHPDPSNTGETDLAAHSGQVVTSVAPLALHLYDRRECGPMMVVTFADGFEAHVFADELIGTPRPDAADHEAAAAPLRLDLTPEQLSLVASAKWLLSNAEEPEGPEGPDYERALVELVASHVLGDVEEPAAARQLLGLS